MRSGGLRGAALGALAVLFACDAPPVREPTYLPLAPPGRGQVLRFGVHPLHNPQRLDAAFGPIAADLSSHCGVDVRLEASRSYAVFEQKLAARELDVALPNPYQTLRALEAGYLVVAKMDNDEQFRGILLVRAGLEGRPLAALRGGRIAFPAPTALAAAMMPQLLLAEAGLVAGRDYEAVYVGSQESSIMAAFDGDVDAAATWPPPWSALSRERPNVAAALRVAASTAPLPNNSVVVRDDLDPGIARCLVAELVALRTHGQSAELLGRAGVEGFVVADAASYAPVVEFVARFERTFGARP